MDLNLEIHTTDYESVEDLLSELDTSRVERTDRGFKGCVTIIDMDLGEMIEKLSNINGTISVLVAYLDDDGYGHGIGYNIRSGVVIDRKSRMNDPDTWHGIVYDGMRVSCEGLH